MTMREQTDELAEVECLLLERLAKQDEKIASLSEMVRRLEGQVTANRTLLCQCEGFISRLGSFSRVLGDEADRFKSL